MPVIRKACERCRERKLKCIWQDDSTSCARCQSKSYSCLSPPQRPSSQKNFKSVKLDERIQLLEGIVAELKGFIPPRDGPSQSGNNHREDGAFPSLSSAVTASSANDLQVAQGNPEIVTLLPYVPDPSQAAIAATRARDLGAPYSSVIKAGDTARDCYLPPAHQGSSLLNEYLHDFNSKIPLFSPDRIHNHVRNCYTGDADGTPLSWVLTYVVLGIAHRLRAMSLFAVPDDTLKPEMYLNKSLAVLPEMLLQEPSVQLVQALLGVSILLQTSGRANRAALFVSNAMYMAQDLGLNDLKQLSHGEPASDKESQYVFWITFMAHTDMSLATGRPSSQRLADISTPLPDNSIADWWNPSTSESQDELWKANIFALNTQLAVIQAEALEELFSVKAHQVPVSIRASAYNIIMSKLQIWRRQSAFASLSPQDAYTTMQHSDLAHWIILEAGYFRTLYQLHAASAMGGFSRRVDVFAPTSLRAIATAENDSLFCDQDARRFLTLAALMPRGNVSTTWASRNALIAALCTILARHGRQSQNPTSVARFSEKAEDVRLCEDALGSLELAAEHADDKTLTSAIHVCSELYAHAKRS